MFMFMLIRRPSAKILFVFSVAFSTISSMAAVIARYKTLPSCSEHLNLHFVLNLCVISNNIETH